MKPSIADNIEILVAAALSDYPSSHSAFKAAQKVEAWLATYSPYKPLK